MQLGLGLSVTLPRGVAAAVPDYSVATIAALRTELATTRVGARTVHYTGGDFTLTSTPVYATASNIDVYFGGAKKTSNPTDLVSYTGFGIVSSPLSTPYAYTPLSEITGTITGAVTNSLTTPAGKFRGDVVAGDRVMLLMGISTSDPAECHDTVVRQVASYDAVGSTLTDLTGNGHDLTNHSATFSNTTGVTFNGHTLPVLTPSYVTIADDAALKPGTATWSGWVTITTAPTANEGTIGVIFDGQEGGTNKGMLLYVNSNRTITLDAAYNINSFEVTSATALTLGTRYFLQVVWAANVGYIYINGALDASHAMNGPLTWGTVGLAMGGYHDGSNFWLTGKIQNATFHSVDASGYGLYNGGTPLQYDQLSAGQKVGILAAWDMVFRGTGVMTFTETLPRDIPVYDSVNGSGVKLKDAVDSSQYTKIQDLSGTYTYTEANKGDSTPSGRVFMGLGTTHWVVAFPGTAGSRRPVHDVQFHDYIEECTMPATGHRPTESQYMNHNYFTENCGFHPTACNNITGALVHNNSCVGASAFNAGITISGTGLTGDSPSRFVARVSTSWGGMDHVYGLITGSSPVNINPLDREFSGSMIAAGVAGTWTWNNALLDNASGDAFINTSDLFNTVTNFSATRPSGDQATFISTQLSLPAFGNLTMGTAPTYYVRWDTFTMSDSSSRITINSIPYGPLTSYDQTFTGVTQFTLPAGLWRSIIFTVTNIGTASSVTSSFSNTFLDGGTSGTLTQDVAYHAGTSTTVGWTDGDHYIAAQQGAGSQGYADVLTKLTNILTFNHAVTVHVTGTYYIPN